MEVTLLCARRMSTCAAIYRQMWTSAGHSKIVGWNPCGSDRDSEGLCETFPTETERGETHLVYLPLSAGGFAGGVHDFVVKILLIRFKVTLLILLAAAAPAGIITSEIQSRLRRSIEQPVKYTHKLYNNHPVSIVPELTAKRLWPHSYGFLFHRQWLNNSYA